MKSKNITCLVTLLIAALPLGLLWKENASLRAQITSQSVNEVDPKRPHWTS
jgi:hypothetical protein